MRHARVFNPNRLSWARRRRGFTKTRLAAAIQVDVRSMTAYETGQFAPDPDKLSELSQVLNFPSGFFFDDDIDEPSTDTVSFRAMSKMTARQRDTALGSAAIALLLNRWIEQRFTLPAPDLPTFDVPVDPEGAAEAVRQHWGLGERPIKNTIHLLESRGIRVFSLAIDASEVDAFSMWFEGRAFVFLNTRKSGERSRFDAAHELGHLVLHRHGTPNGREAEREADAFASALLMPARSVYAHAPRVATLQQLIDLKRLWMVSVSALTYRMHSLGLLSEWHYRQLFRQISARGYRTGEPNAIRREVSQVLHKVFAALREEGVTKHDIAADLQVHPTDINELVFGLVLTSLEGNAARGGRSDRPDLRIVSSNK